VAVLGLAAAALSLGLTMPSAVVHCTLAFFIILTYLKIAQDATYENQ